MLHVNRLSQGQILSLLLTSFLFKLPFTVVVGFFCGFPLFTCHYFFFLLQAQPEARFFPSTHRSGNLCQWKYARIILVQTLLTSTQGETPLMLTLKVKKGEIKEYLLTISVCTDWPVNWSVVQSFINNTTKGNQLACPEEVWFCRAKTHKLFSFECRQQWFSVHDTSRSAE